MYFNTHAVLFATLSLAPTLISAHGKVAAVVGDAGGNGTAIGIQGGIVPGPGKNKVTEVDTTVFGKTNIATNGLGRTTGQGKNTVSMVAATMAQSGSTLPQVSDGGMVSGTYHIVTTDGAGPLMAMIDPTATGQFANGVQANVVTDVPGKKGNIKANGQVPRGLSYWALRARNIVKRAANVNQDFPVKIAVPAGTTCSGTVAGQQNVCFMKIANANRAGPFGGVIAFQMAGTAGAAAPAAGAAAAGTAGTAAGAAAPATGAAGAAAGTAGTAGTAAGAAAPATGAAGTAGTAGTAAGAAGAAGAAAGTAGTAAAPAAGAAGAAGAANAATASTKGGKAAKAGTAKRFVA